MPELSLAAAAALLFDPVHANRHLTRNALMTLGFREIGLPSTCTEAMALLGQTAYDLILLDASEHEDEIARLIIDIRAGRTGINPFAVILTTSWNQSAALVRQLADAGADDILLRPISTGLLEQRIRQQIDARKPFAVTARYIGPDRRSDKVRGSSADLIQVPNTFKEKARGQGNGNFDRGIAQARLALNSRRIQRDAHALGVHCAHMREASGDPTSLMMEIEAVRELIDDLNFFADEQRFANLRGPVAEAGAIASRLNPPQMNLGAEIDALTKTATSILRVLDPRKNEEALALEFAQEAKQQRLRKGARLTLAATG